MSDRYDLLLLKARSEMIGKTTLRKGVDSDSVFNAVWDDVIKAPRNFNQGVDETLNAPQGGPRAWWKHRPQGGPSAWWQRHKDIKALSPERRKEWYALQEQHTKENEVTPQKFAQKHGGLIQDVQAPKPTPKVDAMRADMAKPRDNSNLTGMAQSVQATPPSLPTATDNTTAGQLDRRSKERSAELQGLKGGASVPQQTATPPSVNAEKDKIHQQFLGNTQRMTVPKAQAKRDEALAGLEAQRAANAVDAMSPAPAPAATPAPAPAATPPAPAATPPAPAATPPAPAATPPDHSIYDPAKKKEPEGAARENLTNWLGEDFELSADDDVSLLPFGLIKDTKPPQEGASDYSLLPGGWAEGGVS